MEKILALSGFNTLLSDICHIFPLPIAPRENMEKKSKEKLWKIIIGKNTAIAYFNNEIIFGRIWGCISFNALPIKQLPPIFTRISSPSNLLQGKIVINWGCNSFPTLMPNNCHIFQQGFRVFPHTTKGSDLQTWPIKAVNSARKMWKSLLFCTLTHLQCQLCQTAGHLFQQRFLTPAEPLWPF